MLDELHEVFENARRVKERETGVDGLYGNCQMRFWYNEVTGVLEVMLRDEAKASMTNVSAMDSLLGYVSRTVGDLPNMLLKVSEAFCAKHKVSDYDMTAWGFYFDTMSGHWVKMF